MQPSRRSPQSAEGGRYQGRTTILAGALRSPVVNLEPEFITNLSTREVKVANTQGA
jgi:hypothetical protein